MPSQSGLSDSLVESVAAFIDARKLIPHGAAVVVGVSGGADSVALLEVLCELAVPGGRGYRLSVAHLNHQLRPDADADADFVADLARRRGLPCVIEKKDVAAHARQTGKGIEQAARELRYDFLRRAAITAGATIVAVAHHADDNVETILYRIVRGTHLRGLCGMPVSRELRPAGKQERDEQEPDGQSASATSSVVLIRPLLEVRRSEIEAFCTRRDLAWRTDSTNADVSYRRNFIRRELLPLLREKVSPRCDEAILRLAAGAQEVEEFLSAQAALALDKSRDSHYFLGDTTSEEPIAGLRFSIDRTALAAQPPAIRTAAMRLALERLGAPMRSISAERLMELAALLDDSGPTALALPGGWLARRDGPAVVIEPKSRDSHHFSGDMAGAKNGDCPDFLEYPGDTVLPGGVRITCEVLPFDADAFAEHCRRRKTGRAAAKAGEAAVEFLDADQVRGRLIARPRRDGDAFVPLGSPGRQSVSDFLTNCKLPAAARRSVLCVCDDLGIVYLAPLRIDDRVKVTPNTKRVIRISARRRPQT
ncbi:MAG: tRNA lysidine(34) synthetase TilS [Phycisphaerae bacterium]